jgi:hypothetical protein
LYVHLLSKPAPLRELARVQGVDESKARSVLYQARRRGLLTSAPRGRAGGVLTEKALKLLERAEVQEERERRRGDRSRKSNDSRGSRNSARRGGARGAH